MVSGMSEDSLKYLKSLAENENKMDERPECYDGSSHKA